VWVSAYLKGRFRVAELSTLYDCKELFCSFFSGHKWDVGFDRVETNASRVIYHGEPVSAIKSTKWEPLRHDPLARHRQGRRLQAQEQIPVIFATHVPTPFYVAARSRLDS
jgi:hypothetical protein